MCGQLSGPSRTRGGFFDFEVHGHDGAYEGRVHLAVPFFGRQNGNLIDRQQSYNVLVLRGPGLEEGVMFVIDGQNIHLDATCTRQTYPQGASPSVSKGASSSTSPNQGDSKGDTHA